MLKLVPKMCSGKKLSFLNFQARLVIRPDDFTTEQTGQIPTCKIEAERALPPVRLRSSRLSALRNSNLTLFFLASILVLIPCFWQSRIQAGDLSSHLYNAWLAQLIEHGQLTGLWIARQWTNVLFDFSLEWLFVHFGVRVAERLAVAFAVLVFFWGGFTLLCAVTKKRPWFVVPCLAMLAYGYVFEMGFFNFYLSLGLSFFALALFWRGASRYAVFALPLLALAWTAHPLPVLWCLAVAAYTWIARAVSFRGQLVLFAISIMLLFVLRHFLVHLPSQWSWRQLALVTGADQVVVYGTHYVILGICLLFLWATLYMRESRKGSRSAFSIPVQLTLLAGIGTFLLPDAILSPSYRAPLNFLMARMSVTTAVLACCVSGTAKATNFHRYAFALLSLTFFACLYVDHRTLNRVEDNMTELVQKLRTGQRVTALVSLPPARIQGSHLVDRACIGHCFSYANYEPSTGQFRVRATPDNSVVLSNDSDSKALQEGRYSVRVGDLPLYEIYSCSREDTDLCLRSLNAGETNRGAEF